MGGQLKNSIVSVQLSNDGDLYTEGGERNRLGVIFKRHNYWSIVLLGGQ